VVAGNRVDGPGAIFSVRLPLMVVKPPAESAHPPRVHPAAGGSVSFDCPPELRGVKVLAVDDEADARHLLTAVLEQCGAEVRTSASCAEALAVLEEFEPDVLISDIGMPGEDGYALIRKIRAWEAGRDGKAIPAVALTAYARVEDRLQALVAGYNMHIPKPVEPAELAIVIASLSSKGRQTPPSQG
jgi:CheY-like chemotaxis protein